MRRIGAVLVAAALAWAGAAQAQAVRAKVEGGVVVGQATDKAHVFRNIPFAAPPWVSCAGARRSG
jgi:para-nitrobenzyl esterase